LSRKRLAAAYEVVDPDIENSDRSVRRSNCQKVGLLLVALEEINCRMSGRVDRELGESVGRIGGRGSYLGYDRFGFEIDVTDEAGKTRSSDEEESSGWLPIVAGGSEDEGGSRADRHGLPGAPHAAGCLVGAVVPDSDRSVGAASHQSVDRGRSI